MRTIIGSVAAALLAVGPLALGADAQTAQLDSVVSHAEILPNAEWEIVGDLESANAGGRVVALSGARALLTGYVEDSRRVFLYEPVAGLTRVADAPADLESHFAARLPDGRVLVGGGGGIGEDLRARCFIYDPARDRWSEAAPLPRPSYWVYVNPAVTLRDGQVMVAGGSTPEGAYFDPGVGVDLHLASRHVFLFDATGTTVGAGGRRLTGKWREGAPMPTTRVFTHGPPFASQLGGEGTGIALSAPYSAGRVANATVVLPDGRVLLVGGREYQPGAFYGVPYTDVYDPSKNSWKRLASMPGVPGDGDGGYGGRGFPGVTLLGSGQVLIFGGTPWELKAHTTPNGVTFELATPWPGIASRGSSLLFDPLTGEFTSVGDLNHPRVGPLAAPWREGGGAFAIGGLPPRFGPLPEAEVYDPATRTWFLLPPEPDPTVEDVPRRDGIALTDGTVLTFPSSGTTVKRLHP